MSRKDMRKTEDEDLDESRENVGIRNLKLSAIMCLITLIAFVLFAIFASPKPIESSDSENRGVVESLDKNDEITHPIKENATEGQDLRHLAVDDDGGYWVIEAIPVPEEWRR